MEFGKRIAKLRKSRGMTQEQLGDYLGTTRQAVSKWEAGKAMPELDLIVKMGELFGITMDSLILGRSAPAPAEEETTKTEAPEQNTDEKGGKTGLLAVSIALAAAGFIILCLCPLILNVYWVWLKQSYQSYWPNRIQHLFEWPLLGVLILGIVFLLAGIGGVIWWKTKRNTREHQETN